MMKDLLQTAILVFDDLEFSTCRGCPQCGGAVQGYDTRTKKFATIREDEKERNIMVRVRRFTCRSCGELCYADEPFYPNTRIGSPVIDIFSSLSAAMPASRAARVIDALGIRVNRTSWKNYTGRNYATMPAVDIFGMRLPVYLTVLSNIAARSDTISAPDTREILAACGYPSARNGSGIRDRQRDGRSPAPDTS